MQLRELALLNGTLRENDGPRCTNCGATDHKSWMVSYPCHFSTFLPLKVARSVCLFLVFSFSVLTNPMSPTILPVLLVVELDTLLVIVDKRLVGKAGVPPIKRKPKSTKR